MDATKGMDNLLVKHTPFDNFGSRTCMPDISFMTTLSSLLIVRLRIYCMINPPPPPPPLVTFSADRQVEHLEHLLGDPTHPRRWSYFFFSLIVVVQSLK